MAETLRDLVVSLSLQSDDFSKNITMVNKQIQEAQSKFALASAGVSGFEKTTAGLSAKLAMLKEKQSLQNKSVEQYQRALANANNKVDNAVKKHNDLTTSLEKAKKKQADLKTAVSDMKKEYKANSDAATGDAEAAALLAEKIDLLEQQYKEASNEVKDLEAKVKVSEKSMRNAANNVSDVATKLNLAEAEMREISAEIEKTSTALVKMGSLWGKAEKALESYADKADKVGTATEKVGKTLTQSVTAPIAALGAYAIKAEIDFESAFTGVRKTVDATEEEYAELERAIKDMSLEIPSASEDLAGVMEIAGQLGILRENLVDYTKTVVNLDNTTNLSTEEAATQIAQFANVTGMAQDKVSNLGSAMVYLGNNYATTEAAIMNMATRLGAAGAQVGLSQAQILGFAAALSSVGLEAEAGGTAFSKAMINMQVAVETGDKSLKDFADVAGMTVDAFVALWKSNPADAVESFIVGLSKMNEEGISSIVMLEEMGFSEVRLRDTLLRASNAADLFSKAQSDATKAWEANAALSAEAALRYGTVASQLQILKNKASLAAQSLGTELMPMFKQGVDGASRLIDKFMALDTRQKEQIIKWAAIAAAAGPTLTIFGKFATGSAKAASAILTIGRALGSLGVVNLGALGAAGLGLTVLINGLQKLDERQNQYKDTLAQIFSGVDESKLESFQKAFDTTISTNISVDDYQSKIDGAVAAIRNALTGIESLDPNEKAAIENAIANGTGIDLLEDALTDLNIDQSKIDGIVAAITGASGTINAALAGLGLSEEAKASIAEVAQSGGDLAAALESYGVPEEQAEATAKTITDAMASIGAAAEGVGLTDEQLRAIGTAGISDAAVINAAMLAMGVPQSTIDTVLGSYDTLNGSLSAKIAGTYEAITAALTDGMPDTDETTSALEEQVRALYSGAVEDIESWANEEIAKLDINSATYDADVENIKTKGAEMKAELESQQTATMTFINEMAGQSTAAVQARLGELDEIEVRARAVTAEIEAAKAAAASEGAQAANVVKSGASMNEETAGRAFAHTRQTYEAEMAQIQAEYEADLKALESLGSEAYAEGITALEADFAQQKETALAKYQTEIQALLNGLGDALAAANPEAAAKMQQAVEALEVQNQISGLVDLLNQKLVEGGEEFDAGQLSNELAKALGFGDAQALADQLNAILQDPTLIGTINFQDVMQIMQNRLNEGLAAVESQEGLSSIASIMQGILENGLAQGIDGIDLTTDQGKMEALFKEVGASVPAGMKAGVEENAGGVSDAVGDMASGTIDSAKTALDSNSPSRKFYAIGQDIVQGMINGINSKRSVLLTQIKLMAKAAENAARLQLDTHSPSKVFEDIGQNVVEGFAIGIASEKERRAVEKASRYLASAAVRTTTAETAKMPVTDSRNQSVNVNIQNYNASSNQDVEALAQNIDSLRRRRNRGYGMNG